MSAVVPSIKHSFQSVESVVVCLATCLTTQSLQDFNLKVISFYRVLSLS